MLGEADHLDDATEALVEKQIKRGWYIGGELFKGQLTEMITGHSDNLRGDQRRAHDEKGAEQFISELLGLFELSDAAICAMKSTRLEKQAVAWFLKKNTTVTVVWIASRLEMGHRTNASRSISRFDRSEEAAASEMKDKMLQITG